MIDNMYGMIYFVGLGWFLMSLLDDTDRILVDKFYLLLFDNEISNS